MRTVGERASDVIGAVLASSADRGLPWAAAWKLAVPMALGSFPAARRPAARQWLRENETALAERYAASLARTPPGR